MFILWFLLGTMPEVSAKTERKTLNDEVIYSLLIDRFFDGNLENNRNIDANNPNTFNGGDFAGVIKKLDYLKDMGFTTIILSPIFANEKDSYTGLKVIDFYQTDPHYGSISDFKNLIKEAHKRNMKVMIDFVTNNVGPNHPWVHEANKKDWFHKKHTAASSTQTELETAWIDGLPDLNQENPEVKKYLLDVAKWWIEKTNIDGYRLEQMQYVGLDFWKDFVKTVHSEKADFYLIGNDSGINPKTAVQYAKIGMEAFMDYRQNQPLRNAFAAPDKSLKEILAYTVKNESGLGKRAVPLSFMDTSQLPRFTRDAAIANQHPGTRWKIAFSYLYTTPEVPVILYGSEIALNGNKPPENQQFMDFNTDQELVEYITKLAKIRASSPALMNGKISILYKKDGVAVYKRSLGKDTMVVVLNNTSKTRTISLDQSQLDGQKELRGLLNGDLVRSDGKKYFIVIDREKTEIYKLAHKSIINVPYFIVLFLILAVFALFIALLIKRSKRNIQE